MSGDPATRSLPRSADVTMALLYLLVVSILITTCWLFLSNVDQLVPRERRHSDEMTAWRSSTPSMHTFAGGFWRDDSFWRAVNLTVVTATLTMLLAALLGLPTAYALSRYHVPGRRLVEILFSSIIVLPSSSVGLCLIILCQETILYDVQRRLGITLVYSLPGIVLAQLVLSLAMGISAWKAAFDAVNPRLEHVARTLGSSPWRVFRTVTLPCAKGGVLAGLILAWTRAAAEFGGVLIFCSTFAERPASYFSPLTRALRLHQADTLSVTMWSQIEYGNVEYGFAVGFVLVAISAVSVFVIHRLGGKTYVW